MDESRSEPLVEWPTPERIRIRWVLVSLHHKRYVDVAAYRIAVQANVIRCVHDFHRRAMIEAWNGEDKLYSKP